ncbi:MAG TPA: four helix bundle protein [Anaerolineales bacterium]|nr:four helix bundle protein [Anaerolineales bacterium]HNJ12512.1 four helix bundle protein [Anaerolineales bacterium]
MPTIRRFEEIEAWQTARELTRLVYSITEEGKFAKDFGLKDQIRRACVSIMSNIAEGFESKTQPAFIRYLGIAKASAGEVRAQSYVANDVKYLSDEQFAQLFDIAEKSSRQLSRFISYLEAQPNTYRVKDESPEYET